MCPSEMLISSFFNAVSILFHTQEHHLSKTKGRCIIAKSIL